MNPSESNRMSRVCTAPLPAEVEAPFLGLGAIMIRYCEIDYQQTIIVLILTFHCGGSFARIIASSPTSSWGRDSEARSWPGPGGSLSAAIMIPGWQCPAALGHTRHVTFQVSICLYLSESSLAGPQPDQVPKFSQALLPGPDNH
eukprot:767345-Hanusia_phi.AAC.1